MKTLLIPSLLVAAAQLTACGFFGDDSDNPTRSSAASTSDQSGGSNADGAGQEDGDGNSSNGDAGQGNPGGESAADDESSDDNSDGDGAVDAGNDTGNGDEDNGADDDSANVEYVVADVYADPELGVTQILLADGDEAGNPKEIRLFIPEADGTYPLLQFQHGFISDVDSYTDMLSRLAGFGFVIAAPQMYVSDPSSAPSVPDETSDAVAVLSWVQTNLNDVLAQKLTDYSVSIDAASSGIFGHSRGGQVAWRMLFDHPDTQARAIAGVDPVDGDAPPFPPGGTGELVTDDEGAFQFAFPSLIIGMGLGANGFPGFECAPTNRNYKLFYDASLPSRYEVVAEDFGHSDMLNGSQFDPVCFGAFDGSTRASLRIFIVGQLVAYYGSVLYGGELLENLRTLEQAPVTASGRFEELSAQ